MCDDPSRELVGDFLQAWHTKFGRTPALVKDAIHASQLRGMNGVHQHEILLETMTDIAGERDGSINRKRLGWWIKRHAGQVVNVLRFVQDKSVSSNTAKWKVESVLSV
jgi:hypothetical protein